MRYNPYDLSISLAIAVAATVLFAYTAHSHDIYSEWKTKNGVSCCSSQALNPHHGDCAPLPDTRLRVRGTGVEVEIEGEWVAVEQDKIRPYTPPDGGHHLCHKGKHVLCLVPSFGA